jgi:hypothetical protein
MALFISLFFLDDIIALSFYHSPHLLFHSEALVKQIHSLLFRLNRLFGMLRIRAINPNAKPMPG